MGKKGESYTCTMCKNTYDRSRDDNDAYDEYTKHFKKTWVDMVPVEECAIVCDDCYILLTKPRNTYYDAWAIHNKNL